MELGGKVNRFPNRLSFTCSTLILLFKRATESFYDQGGVRFYNFNNYRLTIACQVAVDPSLLDQSGGDKPAKNMDVDLEVPIRFKADAVGAHLQGGFKLLYKSGMFSDLVLVVNGVERFNVHKVHPTPIKQ